MSDLGSKQVIKEAAVESGTEGTSNSRRGDRQKDLVPPDKLAECHCIVVGVGAVGRQVALQLSALGANSLCLIDFDVVEDVNLGPQGYWYNDIGDLKVIATSSICECQNHECIVNVVTKKFEDPKTINTYCVEGKKNIVFSCVDSITVRGLIWKWCKENKIDFFADARMAGETLRVLSSENPELDEYYQTTLFSEEDAYSGSCTAKSTIYCANIAAGFMIANFTKFLRSYPVERDTTISLLTMDVASVDMDQQKLEVEKYHGNATANSEPLVGEPLSSSV